MPQIAFWGPNINQSGSTTIAASVASIIALDYDYKNLIFSTNFLDNTLESSFMNLKKIINRGSMDFSNIGIDALERLIKSGKLNLENLIDYTTPILKDRLDLMFGTQKRDPNVYNKIMQITPNILKCAKTSYDIILVDIPNGNIDENSLKILEESDLIVINLNQSVNVLDDFFYNTQASPALKNKKYIIVLGRYDRYSKYNTKNIAKLYKYKERIFALPYNTQFFDMQNEHRVLEFFIKYLNVKKSDRNGFFVNEIKELVQTIIQLADGRNK